MRLEEFERIWKSIFLTNLSDVVTPSSAVVLADGKNIRNNLSNLGLGVFPDGPEQGQYIHLQLSIHGTLAEEKIEGRNWRSI